MNKVKIRKKAYLTRKIKEQVILSREGKVLIPSKVSETIPKFFLRIITQEHTLKVVTHQNFTTSKNIGIPNNYVKNNEQREPVKYWEC